MHRPLQRLLRENYGIEDMAMVACGWAHAGSSTHLLIVLRPPTTPLHTLLLQMLAVHLPPLAGRLIQTFILGYPRCCLEAIKSMLQQHSRRLAAQPSPAR